MDSLKESSFLDHLKELRSRLIKSTLIIILSFAVFFFFSDDLLNFFKAPLLKALPAGSKNLYFTGPLDVFSASIKVSLIGALIFSAPLWITQVYLFVAPGLYDKEKRYAAVVLVAVIALFYSGVFFSYYVVLPMGMDFFISYGMEVGLPIVTISDYLSFFFILILGFGFVFELPCAMVFLTIAGLTEVKTIREYRKLIIIGILVLSAVLTPPDPISQMAMALPLYVMFEISLIVASKLERKRVSL